MGSRGPATAVVEGSVLNLSVEMSAPPTWLSTGRSRAVGRLASLLPCMALNYNLSQSSNPRAARRCEAK